MNNNEKLKGQLIAYLNGGKGSGNWGHSGRPGLVGGSAAGGGRSSKSKKSKRSSKSKDTEPSVIEPTKIAVGELSDSTDKTGKYTEAEKRAVERYVSGDMMWVNQYLRGRMPEDTVLQPDEEKFIEDLKSATSKPIGKDMTLYRSVDASAVFGDMTPTEFGNLTSYVVYGDTQRLIARDAIRLLERAEDSEITEKGFMSTTTGKSTAMNWFDFSGAEYPITLELNVPSTVGGANISEVSQELEHRMNQQEILLQPNLTYRITDISSEDGLIYVKADVISNKRNRLEKAKEGFAKYLNGGKGSGNWGHDGRPGKVGGSSPRGGGSSKAKPSSRTRRGLSAEAQEKLGEAKKSIANSEQDLVGKRQRAIGVLQSLDLYAEPGRYDVDGEQWVVENPLELNDDGDDEILQYAFNKDGDKKTVVELGLTDKASREKHYTESYAEHPRYDLKEFRKKNKTDSSISDEALNKIRDFTDDSYARSEALRKGNVSEDDRIIDSVFEASENGSETVYRGLQGDYAKQIANLNVGDTFTDPSYVYTTRDLNIANYFSKDVSGERGTVLVINLPDGKGISLNLDNIGTAYSAQQQTLLNRDLQFTVTGKKGNVVIVEASKKDNENRNSLSICFNVSQEASKAEKRSAKLVQLVQNYNHRHDRLGRFARATGGGAVYDDYHEITISEHGKADRTIRISSKRSADIDEISRKAGTSDYASELEKVPDDVVKHIANENIPRITAAELNSVRRKRRAAYLDAGKTDEDFERSNQALLDARGSGGEFYRKAEIEGADLSIERKLSQELMGDNEILVFRQQDGEFQKTGHNETSRWSDIPYAGNGSGDDYYSAIVTKDNIVIHPLILYSADKNDSVNIVAGREREYILENSKIDKIKKGIRLV